MQGTPLTVSHGGVELIIGEGRHIATFEFGFIHPCEISFHCIILFLTIHDQWVATVQPPN